MTQIKPIGNRVLVELLIQPQTSKSGIIIAAESKTEQSQGIILAIGSGFGEIENIASLGLNMGDKVVFGRYSGEEIANSQNPAQQLKILKTNEIIAQIID
jgi:chaperonin GroES